MGGRAEDNQMFKDSVVTVTAQWVVKNPIVYINNSTEGRCVDLAVSNPVDNVTVAHFQFNSPLEAMTAGHNMFKAGLDLAKTLGFDIDELKAATPSDWWSRDQ